MMLNRELMVQEGVRKVTVPRGRLAQLLRDITQLLKDTTQLLRDISHRDKGMGKLMVQERMCGLTVQRRMCRFTN